MAKIKYNESTDTLTVVVSDQKSFRTDTFGNNITLDYDKKNRLVRIAILGLAKHIVGDIHD